MNHGHIDQVATSTALFNAPASQFVAKFIGDNNIFTGKVIDTSSNRTDQELIELDVEGMGAIFCQGIPTAKGSEAACSVRPDLIELSPVSDSAMSTPSVGATRINSAVARVMDVEMTGYVTRVSLVLEATGQSLLYKARTTDWTASDLGVGQSVSVRWSAEDCVFLPY